VSGKGVQINAQEVREAELNLIGMRVEDALEELDRFIDRAILQGMPKVKVLHGVGTGKLMTAVKEHLHDVDYVKLKKDERNAGVTVIELV
jgi:DNA mismatch repair protein MutS2